MIQSNRPSITSGVIAALFLTLLAACGGGTETPDIEAASFEPETILIATGDLPADYSGGEVAYEGMPFLEEDLNLAQNWVRQDLAYMGEGAGGVYVGISDRAADSKALYDLIVESFGRRNIDQEGLLKITDKTTAGSGAEITYTSMRFGKESRDLPKQNTVVLTFHQHHYTGYIVLTSTRDPNGMIAYIEKMSARLDEMLGY